MGFELKTDLSGRGKIGFFGLNTEQAKDYTISADAVEKHKCGPLMNI